MSWDSRMLYRARGPEPFGLAQAVVRGQRRVVDRRQVDVWQGRRAMRRLGRRLVDDAVGERIPATPRDLLSTMRRRVRRRVGVVIVQRIRINTPPWGQGIPVSPRDPDAAMPTDERVPSGTDGDSKIDEDDSEFVGV